MAASYLNPYSRSFGIRQARWRRSSERHRQSRPLSVQRSSAGVFPPLAGTNESLRPVWRAGRIACSVSKEYPLEIRGLRVGATAGVAVADLEGVVFGLDEPSDSEGEYGATQAAIAVISGEKFWRLRNDKGVTLRLHGRQRGLDLSLDVGGMRIMPR